MAVPHDSPARNYQREEDEIKLLDLLLFLIRNIKRIVVFSLVGLVLAAVAILLRTDSFSVTVRFLPLNEKDTGRYLRLVNSPVVTKAIVEKFNLADVYQQKSRNEDYQVLSGRVHIQEENKDHILALSVEDEDLEHAAEMATAYVEELRKVVEKRRLENTMNFRQFLEGRLKAVRKELVLVERKLKIFREKNKSVQLDGQMLSSIEAIAKLKGEIAHQEIELGGREDFRELEARLSALEQSALLKKVPGDIALAASGQGEGQGLQYAGLLSEFRTKTMLLELLTLQYEVAGIDEAKSLPGIQGIEMVGISSSRIGQPKVPIMFLATFLGCFLGILSASIREYAGRMSDEDRRRWEAIRGALKSGWKPRPGDSVSVEASTPAAGVSSKPSIES